jgi:hypothetical protein
MARASPPPAERSLSAVPGVRKDPEVSVLHLSLFHVARLTPGGACLYAALAYLWFEHLVDAEQIAKLERARGHKRLGPIVVTAEELFPFTNLKKDGIAARIRELEEPHPCIWSGCAEPHPLITVKRLGQGLGLQIARYLCGDATPVGRKRVIIRQPVTKRDSGEGSGQAALIESAALPPSEIACENTAPPSSEITRQNAASTPSKTRERRLLQDGNDHSQNAASTPSLLRYSAKETKKAAAAESAAAAADEKKDAAGDDRARIADALRALAGRSETDPDDHDLDELLERLLQAAITRHGNDATHALERAMHDPRVLRANRPIAMLVRGVLGDDTHRGFLLDLPRTSPRSEFPDLAESMRPHLEIAHAFRAKNTEDDSVSPFPLGDRLATEDPETYHARLRASLARIDLPKKLGIAPSLDHVLVAAAARRQLENDLREEST